MPSATSYVLATVPLVSSFAVGRLFPQDMHTKSTVLIPPYMFGVVWFILNSLIGLSWAISRENPFPDEDPLSIDIVFAVLVALLCSWVVITYFLNKWQSNRRWISLIVLYLTGAYVFGLVTYLIQSVDSKWAASLLAPLAFWLVTATSLWVDEARTRQANS